MVPTRPALGHYGINGLDCSNMMNNSHKDIRHLARMKLRLI